MPLLTMIYLEKSKGHLDPTTQLDVDVEFSSARSEVKRLGIFHMQTDM